MMWRSYGNDHHCDAYTADIDYSDDDGGDVGGSNAVDSLDGLFMFAKFIIGACGKCPRNCSHFLSIQWTFE